MRERSSRLTRLRRDERGISTVELVVASGILSMMMIMVMPLTMKGFNLLTEHESRATVDANVEIAMRQMTRDVRSGNVIGTPYSVNGKAGMGVRIYTQTDGVPFRCVEYQVSGSNLERRQRDPEAQWEDNWSIVVGGATNATSNPTKAAFSRSVDKSTLSVSIVLDPVGLAKPVEANVSITGRNTKYYDTPFAETTCA